MIVGDDEGGDRDGDRGDKGDKGDQGDPGPTDYTLLTNVPGEFTPASHSHGSINNDGVIWGASPGDPVVVGSFSNITTGTFGSSSGSFCAGDDPRLSGNVRSDVAGIANASAIANIVTLVQDDYDDIETKSASTVYIVTAPTPRIYLGDTLLVEGAA
jgi:hypothetical protein